MTPEKMVIENSVRPLRIGWFSNSPHAPSGYGQQTRLIASRLRDYGHEMALFVSHGIQFGAMLIGDIPCYPSSHNPSGDWSQHLVGPYSRHFNADITVCFVDAWVLKPELYGEGVRPVMMFPIDTEGIPPGTLDKIQKAWARITYSRFGYEQVKAASLESYYIPHGVDLQAYQPMDREEARKQVFLPDDGRFIVCVVAANNDPLPTRKGWEQIFDGWRRFKASGHPKAKDALLYLHTTINGRTNLEHLALSYGFNDGKSIAFCDQLQQYLGFDTEFMRATYAASDVLLCASTGEGFGLPLLEAQASGTPVIAPDWTATSELIFSGMRMVKKPENRFMNNLFAFQYLADPDVINEALCAFCDAEAEWPEYRIAAREGAMHYDINKIVLTHWLPVLDELKSRCEEEDNEHNRVRQAKSSPGDYRDSCLAEIKEMPFSSQPKVVMVVPSWNERCGIAEYSGFTMNALQLAGIPTVIVETCTAASAIARQFDSVEAVILQHEYVFFDNRSNRLGRGESTIGAFRELLNLKQEMSLKGVPCKVGVILHTVSPKPYERGLNRIITQFIEEGLPFYATSVAGASFLGARVAPLGAFPIPGVNPQPDPDFIPPDVLTIGNFGIFGPHRDIQGQAALCHATGSKLLGSFYCDSMVKRGMLNTMLSSVPLVDMQVWTDYGTPLDIMERLQGANILYMPRPDAGLFYASASVLMALNALKPIIVNRAACYEDLGDCVLYADTLEEAIEQVNTLRDPGFYFKCQVRMRNYLERRSVVNVYREAGLI